MKKFKLLTTGTADLDDPDLVGRIVFVNTLCIVIGILLVAIGIPICTFLQWRKPVVIPLSVEFLLNASVLYFNYRRKRQFASLLFYFLQCAAILYFSLLLGDLFHLQFVFMFLFSIIFLIFRTKTTRYVAITGTFLAMTILQISYYSNSFHPVSMGFHENYISQTLVMYGVLLLMLFVSGRYVRSHDTNEELKRANHLIKIFTAQFTHELRTPLDSVHQVTQLLRKEVQTDPNNRKLLPLVDIGYTVTSNARNIVNNVLDLAAIEAGKVPEVTRLAFKIAPFLQKIIDVHAIMAHQEELKLTLQIDASMPEVIFDDSLTISQILTNLLSNALKYGSRKSTVTVAVFKYRQTWRLIVSNSGPGIAQDKIASIFDPFVTGRTGLIQGTGLGLYIVKNKVKLLGGTIEVDSVPLDKTSFTVTLPLKAGTLSDLPKDLNPSGQATNLHPVYVLAAEDNPSNSFLLGRFLKQLGCSYTLVDNGKALLEIANAKCPGNCPDIIIMDSNMPILNGEQTILQIRQLQALKHIPIIVTSADPYSTSVSRMLKAGANCYLKKPLDHVALQNAISQELMDKGSLADLG